MRITGIQAHNYAGLEQQYIPIGKGVRLLVGKNNAGKSALLRLLKFQTDQGWQDYLTKGKPASVRVWYGPDDSDSLLTRKATSGQTVVVPGEQIEVRIDLPRNSGPRFNEADLLTVKGETLPLIATRTSTSVVQYVQYWYGTLESGAVSSRGTNAPNAGELHIPNDLKEAILIKPNRAVAYPMPANATRGVPNDGRALAPFLQTLKGDNDDLYALIEERFCVCFPEFKRVNVKFQGDGSGPSQPVVVTLTEKGGRRIDLPNCGAGVEQALIMLTCVFGTEKETLFLVDEPHNFLHPSLERVLIDLFSESHHSFLLATHSAQMINRVAPEQITTIARPGTAKPSQPVASADKGKLLGALGYRNSDLLFHDALVFVEGPSDPPILGELFSRAGCWPPEKLDLGYVELGGAGEFSRFEDIQKLVIVQEKLLHAFARADIPHVYLFDGDKGIYKEQLEKTRPSGHAIRPVFLPVYETENYLLDAEAIEISINAELVSLNVDKTASVTDIQARLDQLLDPSNLVEADRKRFYPQGFDGRDPRVAIKGSSALRDIYANYLLKYNKRASGAELVSHVSLSDMARAEIQDVFKGLALWSAET